VGVNRDAKSYDFSSDSQNRGSRAWRGLADGRSRLSPHTGCGITRHAWLAHSKTPSQVHSTVRELDWTADMDLSAAPAMLLSRRRQFKLLEFRAVDCGRYN
jgi:hypothetical protein